jgi:hypothetical protein
MKQFIYYCVIGVSSFLTTAILSPIVLSLLGVTIY